MISKRHKTFFELLLVFASKSTSQGTLFLLNVIIARMLLPEDYGIWVTMINTITLLAQLSDLGLNTGYIRYGSVNVEHETKLRVLNRIALRWKVGVSLVIIIAGLTLSYPLAEYFIQSEDAQGLLIISFIGSIGISLFGFLVSYLQIKQKFLLLSKIEIVNNLLRLVLILFLLLAGVVTIDLFIIIYCFIPLAIYMIFHFRLILSEVKVSNEDKLLYQKDLNHELLHFTKWVLISSFSVMLITKIDVYVIQFFYSSHEVGLYASANQLSMMFPLITTSLTTVLLPKVSRFTNSYEIIKYIRNIFMFVPVVGTIFISIIYFSNEIILIVFGENYTSVSNILKILLFGSIIGTIINPLSLIFYTLKKEKMLTILNVSQLLILIVLNIILVPTFSITGAAIASTAIRLIGGIYIIVVSYYYVQRLKREETAVSV